MKVDKEMVIEEHYLDLRTENRIVRLVFQRREIPTQQKPLLAFFIYTFQQNKTRTLYTNMADSLIT